MGRTWDCDEKRWGLDCCSGDGYSGCFGEMTWRFNNRKNPYLFRDTMLKLLEAPVLEYRKLTPA
jgi:hypothetical protein